MFSASIEGSPVAYKGHGSAEGRKPVDDVYSLPVTVWVGAAAKPGLRGSGADSAPDRPASPPGFEGTKAGQEREGPLRDYDQLITAFIKAYDMKGAAVLDALPARRSAKAGAAV